MECFQVRYDSRVVIYERKLFIRLATDLWSFMQSLKRADAVKLKKTLSKRLKGLKAFQLRERQNCFDTILGRK